MKKYIHIHLMSMVLCFFIPLLAPAQELEISIQPEAIKIGERATITYSLSFPITAKEVVMPAVEDTLTESVEVIAVSSVDSAIDQSDIQSRIFTQSVEVTSWDSGFHAIPPFKFKVDGDSLKSKPLLLEVKSVTLSAEQDIKDIKQIKDVPFSLWDWLLAHRNYFAWGLLGLILLTILIYLIRKTLRKKEQAETFVPKEAADIVANRKLKELQAKKLWENDKVKAYYSELSYIIREYIENRYEINALELTTDENLLLIRVKIKEENLLSKLATLFKAADLAKYAKQKPLAEENKEALQSAFYFVEATAFREEVVASEEESEDAGLKKEENA